MGCFCKDQMHQLDSSIAINLLHDPYPKTLALINTGELKTNGEHWMAVVINKRTKLRQFQAMFQMAGGHS